MFRLVRRLGPAMRGAVRPVATQTARNGRSWQTAGAVAAVGLSCGLLAQPAQCFFWSSKKPSVWDNVKKDLTNLVDDEACGPLLVRLAWHCSGTYDKNSGTGGSNGATMRFGPEASDGANAGLDLARNLLEPLKAKYPDISYADLYTYAGAVAIEAMGGPEIPWKPGREDASDESACPPNGRLPDATQGPGHIRDVFYRMGFNDREITALVGAHTLGECHADRSGFVGPWTRDPLGFDNQYFTLLFEEKWVLEIPKNGPAQFWNESHDLMMLPADIAMVTDPEFRKISAEYATDGDKFNKDFAAAFGKLLALGVPGQ